jgi:hypothetical protein
MPRVLADLRERLDLRQLVFPRVLNVALDRQRPLLYSRGLRAVSFAAPTFWLSWNTWIRPLFVSPT